MIMKPKIPGEPKKHRWAIGGSDYPVVSKEPWTDKSVWTWKQSVKDMNNRIEKLEKNFARLLNLLEVKL